MLGTFHGLIRRITALIINKKLLRSKYGILSRCGQPERLVARERKQRCSPGPSDSPVSIKLFVLTQVLIDPCILMSNIQIFSSVSLHYLWPTSVFLPPAMSSTLCSPYWMNLRFCRWSKFDSQPLYSRAAFKDVTDDISSVLKQTCRWALLCSRFQTLHMEAGPHVALGFEYEPRSVPESSSEQWWHSA